MRTTVDLDGRLLERAKHRAAEERRSLGALLNDALAAYLGNRRAPEQDAPFELLVRGKLGGRFPDPSEVVAAEEEEDAAALALPRKTSRAAS